MSGRPGGPRSIFSPPRFWRLPAMALVWNGLVYGGANLLMRDRPHGSMETALDGLVPFLPWTVSIYFGCFLFWAVSYILYARRERARAYRFYFADLLAKSVCLVFFLFLPTTNVRPAVEGFSFWDTAMRFLYWVDPPSNLFPSIHCLASWLCYLGVRGDKELPLWLRGGACLLAVAICLSTLTTKQHVVWDVVGGVALAELSYSLAGLPPARRVSAALYDRLTKERGQRAS